MKTETSEMVQKIRNFDFFKEKILGLEKYFPFFSRNIFDLKNLYFVLDCFLYQPQIFPGIQKSYLENRAIILESRAATNRAVVIFRGITRNSAETRKS